MELTTVRLRLRPFSFADQEAIHRVYADPEVMRYVGLGTHRTMAQTANALRIYDDVLARCGYSFLAVVERASGRVIGDGGLHPLGGTGPDAELGYTLARSAWGRGYATELGQALVDYAFTVLRMRRVVAQVEPANVASRRVLAKLGMTACEERAAFGRPHLLYAIERADRALVHAGRAMRPAAPHGSPPRR